MCEHRSECVWHRVRVMLVISNPDIMRDLWIPDVSLSVSLPVRCRMRPVGK